MKHNKTGDTLLSLLLFTLGQLEKKIVKTLFVSASAQKRWKTEGSESTLL